MVTLLHQFLQALKLFLVFMLAEVGHIEQNEKKGFVRKITFASFLIVLCIKMY